MQFFLPLFFHSTKKEVWSHTTTHHLFLSSLWSDMSICRHLLLVLNLRNSNLRSRCKDFTHQGTVRHNQVVYLILCCCCGAAQHLNKLQLSQSCSFAFTTLSIRHLSMFSIQAPYSLVSVRSNLRNLNVKIACHCRSTELVFFIASYIQSTIRNVQRIEHSVVAS